jgi:hypothetical protein
MSHAKPTIVFEWYAIIWLLTPIVTYLALKPSKIFGLYFGIAGLILNVACILLGIAFIVMDGRMHEMDYSDYSLFWGNLTTIIVGISFGLWPFIVWAVLILNENTLSHFKSDK